MSKFTRKDSPLWARIGHGKVHLWLIANLATKDLIVVQRVCDLGYPHISGISLDESNDLSPADPTPETVCQRCECAVRKADAALRRATVRGDNQ